MELFWSFWVVLIAVSFGVFEWWALHTGRATLSRTVWEFSKAWPPLPWVAGVLVGFLAAHFWWIGMGCDIANGVG
jgi:hypothetical protein